MSKIIDIIILSFAQNDELTELTQTGINSLIDSEDPEKIEFNILVIESEKRKAPFQYPGSKTIYPDTSFSFNKYLNIGINATNREFICLCNNDLIFHKNWASEILNLMNNDSSVISASPFCPRSHPDNNFNFDTGVYCGYRERKELAGWCIFVRRVLFDTIGLFDENIHFWYSDRDYALTLQKHHLKHCLVTSSQVTHLQEYTTIHMDEVTRKKFTSGQQLYFDYKWTHHNHHRYMLELIIFNIQISLLKITGASKRIFNRLKRVF